MLATYSFMKCKMIYYSQKNPMSNDVQRAEIEWSSIIAPHARGRFALNFGKGVTLCKFPELPRVTRTCVLGQHHSQHHSSPHSSHHSSHQEDDRYPRGLQRWTGADL